MTQNLTFLHNIASFPIFSLPAANLLEVSFSSTNWKSYFSSWKMRRKSQIRKSRNYVEKLNLLPRKKLGFFILLQINTQMKYSKIFGSVSILKETYTLLSFHCLQRAESSGPNLLSCNMELADQSELCTYVHKTVAWTQKVHPTGPLHGFFIHQDFHSCSHLWRQEPNACMTVDVLIWQIINWEKNYTM